MTASRLASRFLTLILAGALAAGLGACAAGTLPPVGAGPTPAIAASDLLARSAEAIRAETGPADVEITMHGSVDASPSAAAVSLDGVTVSMSFDATPLTMLVKIHVPKTFDMEMRIVDGIGYVSMPDTFDGWYSVSLDEAAALSQTTPSLGGAPVPSIDPKVVEDLVAGPGLTIEYGAPQQLDGRVMDVVEITATKAWIENILTTALDATGRASTMPVSLDEMTAALPAEIPVTVWIDAQSYLIRRITVSVEAPGGEEIGATVDIRPHAGPLDVQAPPADEVKPIEDLMGGSMPALPDLPLESAAP